MASPSRDYDEAAGKKSRKRSRNTSSPDEDSNERSTDPSVDATAKRAASETGTRNNPHNNEESGFVWGSRLSTTPQASLGQETLQDQSATAARPPAPSREEALAQAMTYNMLSSTSNAMAPPPSRPVIPASVVPHPLQVPPFLRPGSMSASRMNMAAATGVNLNLNDLQLWATIQQLGLHQSHQVNAPFIETMTPNFLSNPFSMANPTGSLQQLHHSSNTPVNPQDFILGGAAIGRQQSFPVGGGPRLSGVDSPFFLNMGTVLSASRSPLLHHQGRASIGVPPRHGSFSEQPLTDQDTLPQSHGRCLYLPSDDDMLSDQQCLIRKQIEFFEADTDDVEIVTPGRRKEVLPGQVGIRCIHCAWVPVRQRTRGAVYYPSKLKGLYQAAQNMSVSHFCETCQNIDPLVRAQLKAYHEAKSTVGHGGKQYWADGARLLGVIEDTERDRLRFDPSWNTKKKAPREN